MFDLHRISSEKYHINYDHLCTWFHNSSSVQIPVTTDYIIRVSMEFFEADSFASRHLVKGF